MVCRRNNALQAQADDQTILYGLMLHVAVYTIPPATTRHYPTTIPCGIFGVVADCRARHD